MKKNRLPYKKSANFKVPKNYFETLDARIMKSVAPVENKEFSDQNKEAGFRIPDGYFESFEARLSKKMKDQSKPSKVIALLNRESFYYAAGIAAVFVAIVTTFLFDNPKPTTFDSVNIVSLEGYINEMLEFSTSDVSQFFNEGEYSFDSSSQSNFDQEAVYDYLSENIDEASIIYNED